MKPIFVAAFTLAIIWAWAAWAAPAAYACIPIATLTLSDPTAVPGAKVTATMQQASAKAGPITLHWNAVDGPVLATVLPTETGLRTTFTVPESAAGNYIVVATQPLTPDVATWGMPARAAIHVTTPGGPPVGAAAPAASAGELRPSGLLSDTGPGAILLVLAAIATGGIGLIIAGAAALVAGRGVRTAAVQRPT